MRRGVWLIWLCLALLPLRGMAHATMLATGSPLGATAVAMDSATPSPCAMHGTDVAHPEAAPAHDGAAGGSQYSHSCHLCALCHSAALPMALLADADDAVPDAAPAAPALLGAGRLGLDGLFRPPR